MEILNKLTENTEVWEQKWTEKKGFFEAMELRQSEQSEVVIVVLWVLSPLAQVDGSSRSSKMLLPDDGNDARGTAALAAGQWTGHG